MCYSTYAVLHRKILAYFESLVFFEKLVPKQNNFFLYTLTHHYYSSITVVNTTMVQRPRKDSVEERSAYPKDPARLEKEASLAKQNQKQLKQEALSWFKETKRKHIYNDDELSVVLATKYPKELKGYNNVAISSHWNTPKTSKRMEEAYGYLCTGERWFSCVDH